jgi:hypothetical protein
MVQITGKTLHKVIHVCPVQELRVREAPPTSGACHLAPSQGRGSWLASMPGDQLPESMGDLKGTPDIGHVEK